MSIILGLALVKVQNFFKNRLKKKFKKINKNNFGTVTAVTIKWLKIKKTSGNRKKLL